MLSGIAMSQAARFVQLAVLKGYPPPPSLVIPKPPGRTICLEGLVPSVSFAYFFSTLSRLSGEMDLSVFLLFWRSEFLFPCGEILISKEFPPRSRETRRLFLKLPIRGPIPFIRSSLTFHVDIFLQTLFFPRIFNPGGSPPVSSRLGLVCPPLVCRFRFYSVLALDFWFSR